MKKTKKERLFDLTYSILGIVFVLAVWSISANLINDEYVLPTLSQTIKATFALLGQGDFYNALFATLFRTMLAFIISFVLAGITAGFSLIFKPLGKMVKPIVTVIRVLPTMAILLLIFRWTNYDYEVSPIIIAVLVLFPMIYAQFLTAIRSVPQGLINTANVFGLSKKDKLVKVYLPIIAPSVLSRVGNNLSFAIKLIISAEIMAYTFISLGGMMNTATAYLDYARLAGLTLCAVALGLIIEVVCGIIVKRLFKWTGESKND